MSGIADSVGYNSIIDRPLFHVAWGLLDESHREATAGNHDRYDRSCIIFGWRDREERGGMGARKEKKEERRRHAVLEDGPLPRNEAFN